MAHSSARKARELSYEDGLWLDELIRSSKRQQGAVKVSYEDWLMAR